MAEATEAPEGAEEHEPENQGAENVLNSATNGTLGAEAADSAALQSAEHPPCAVTADELQESEKLADEAAMREEHLAAGVSLMAKAGIEKGTLTLEGGGITVSGDINPFSGDGSMKLIDRFREMLAVGGGQASVEAAVGQGEAGTTASPAAAAVDTGHDFPDESASAVCSKCGHRRWQLAPDQPCK